MTEERFSIGELAERGGVSRRTVRYYVQRGLIDAPLGLGRGRHYGPTHLAQLIRVRDLQARGVPLADILSPPDPARSEPSPGVWDRASAQRTWSRIHISDGVEVHLRDRRLSESEIQRVKDALLRVLEKESRHE